MPSPRVIKKYPNRRLYDTELSRYITLANIRELVMSGVSFQVIDTNSNEDLTRSILLQIMLEEESGGEPLFSSTKLSQIIRFYGGTTQSIFTRYLEESLSLFVQQQEQLKNLAGTNPIQTMTDMAQHNMEMWSDMQRNFFKATSFSSGGKNSKK